MCGGIINRIALSTRDDPGNCLYFRLLLIWLAKIIWKRVDIGNYSNLDYFYFIFFSINIPADGTRAHTKNDVKSKINFTRHFIFGVARHLVIKSFYH